MSISRGEFLKSLGKSIPGLVLNSGAATAAHRLLAKMSAASGTPPNLQTSAKPRQTIPPAETVTCDEFGHIQTGPAQENRVALTFDDGPNPGVTDRILDEFKLRSVHATFFMIGERIARNPELARRVLAEGHDVANHTYTHPKLPELTDEQADAEIQKTKDIMEQMMNHHANYFRPPYGVLRADQFDLLKRHRLKSVLGDVSPRDWSEPGEEQIIERVLTGAKAGSIIICHDLAAQTANSIGPILDGLLARNLMPVTLSSFLG